MDTFDALVEPSGILHDNYGLGVTAGAQLETTFGPGSLKLTTDDDSDDLRPRKVLKDSVALEMGPARLEVQDWFSTHTGHGAADTADRVQPVMFAELSHTGAVPAPYGADGNKAKISMSTNTPYGSATGAKVDPSMKVAASYTSDLTAFTAETDTGAWSGNTSMSVVGKPFPGELKSVFAGIKVGLLSAGAPGAVKTIGSVGFKAPETLIGTRADEYEFTATTCGLFRDFKGTLAWTPKGSKYAFAAEVVAPQLLGAGAGAPPAAAAAAPAAADGAGPAAAAARAPAEVAKGGVAVGFAYALDDVSTLRAKATSTGKLWGNFSRQVHAAGTAGGGTNIGELQLTAGVDARAAIRGEGLKPQLGLSLVLTGGSTAARK